MRYAVRTYAINGRKIDESEHDTPEDAVKHIIKELNDTGWVVEIRIIDRERQKHQGQ